MILGRKVEGVDGAPGGEDLRRILLEAVKLTFYRRAATRRRPYGGDGDRRIKKEEDFVKIMFDKSGEGLYNI